jgi:hypothetical protein
VVPDETVDNNRLLASIGANDPFPPLESASRMSLCYIPDILYTYSSPRTVRGDNSNVHGARSGCSAIVGSSRSGEGEGDKRWYVYYICI